MAFRARTHKPFLKVKFILWAILIFSTNQSSSRHWFVMQLLMRFFVKKFQSGEEKTHKRRRIGLCSNVVEKSASSRICSHGRKETQVKTNCIWSCSDLILRIYRLPHDTKLESQWFPPMRGKQHKSMSLSLEWFLCEKINFRVQQVLEILFHNT